MHYYWFRSPPNLLSTPLPSLIPMKAKFIPCPPVICPSPFPLQCCALVVLADEVCGVRGDVSLYQLVSVYNQHQSTTYQACSATLPYHQTQAPFSTDSEVVPEEEKADHSSTYLSALHQLPYQSSAPVPLVCHPCLCFRSPLSMISFFLQTSFFDVETSSRAREKISGLIFWMSLAEKAKKI